MILTETQRTVLNCHGGIFHTLTIYLTLNWQRTFFLSKAPACLGKHAFYALPAVEYSLHSANCFCIVFCSSSCWLSMFCPVSISQCSGKELICWATSSSVSIDVTFRFSGGEKPGFKLIKYHLFFSQVSIFVHCQTLIDVFVNRSVQFLYDKKKDLFRWSCQYFHICVLLIMWKYLAFLMNMVQNDFLKNLWRHRCLTVRTII